MRMVGRLVGGAILAASLLVSVIGLPVSAGTGIAVGPSQMTINVVRGGVYERAVVLMNSGDEDLTYAVKAGGQMASWLSLAINGAPADRVTVATGGKQAIEIVVTVPKDAANGTYSASVDAVSQAPSLAAGQSGQGLAAAAQSVIVLNVGGEQVMAGAVTAVSAEDVEAGYPVVFKVFAQNDGNVEISPLIEAEITKDGASVAKISQNHEKVAPGATETLSLSWDTTGRAPTNYDARVTVTVGDKKLADQKIKFNVLALGSITRAGELKQILLQGNIGIDQMTRVVAVFVNQGQIDTWAVFKGELYVDGSLVSTLETDKLLIERGREGQLITYIKPAKAGKYAIKGQVIYEGKQTEVKEITFDVSAVNAAPAAVSSSGDAASSTFVLPVGIGIGVLAAAAVGIVLFKRRSMRPT